MKTCNIISKKSKINIDSNSIPFCIEKDILTEDTSNHQHDFSQLFIISNGKATHVIDNHEYKIREGHVYVIKESVMHQFKNVENLELYNVLYNSEELMKNSDILKRHPGFQALFVIQPYYQSEYNFKSKLQLDFGGLKYVLGILNILLQELKSKRIGYETIIQSYFMILITFLSREYIQGNMCNHKKMLGLAQAIAYLESNYLNQITLKDLSEKAFLSPRQFTRIFKSNYNTTPINYLINLRIKHACFLLRNSDLSIINVAVESGFSDSTYFCRQFRKIVGMSPGDYRVFSQECCNGTMSC